MSRRREERRCSRCSDPAMPAPCGPRTRLPAGNMAHIHECGRPRYTSTSCTTPPGTVTLAPDITFAWLLGTSHGHTPSTIHIRRQAWQGHARVRHALLLRSRLLQTVAPKHRSKLKLCQQAGINSSSSDSSCSTGAATAPAPARRRRHQRRCRARRRRRQRRRLDSADRTAMRTASYSQHSGSACNTASAAAAASGRSASARCLPTPADNLRPACTYPRPLR